MMRFRAILTGTSLLLAVHVCGCAMRGNVELLEARLRQQEDQLARLDTKLQTTEGELAAAEREALFLREQLVAKGEKALLPEQADTLFRATGIQFNKLLTGGLDRDGIEGDELLSAVVVPHDADGELVKIPGEIEVEAYDLSREGEQKQIGRWRYGTDSCRELWHSGFLGSGYLVRVPWAEKPQSNRIMLRAKLTTTDGRVFETSEPVDITPPEQTPGLIQAGRKLPAKDASNGGDVDEWGFGAAPERLPANTRQKSLRRTPEAGKNAPETPAGPIRTSDVWTDETLPVVR